MFLADHKTSFIAAIAVVCIGLTGNDIISQRLVRADLQDQFYAVEEYGPVDIGANMIVSRNARYIGGKKAMRQDLSESFIYPVDESEIGDEGKVLVRFTISPDGSVSSATVIRSLSTAIDSAVRAAVLTLSMWEPAIQNGQAVESTVVIPFKVNQ